MLHDVSIRFRTELRRNTALFYRPFDSRLLSQFQPLNDLNLYHIQKATLQQPDHQTTTVVVKMVSHLEAFVWESIVLRYYFFLLSL